MIVLALVVVLSATAGGLPTADTEPTCENNAQYNLACRCDPVCAQYGDCCRDAPYFVPERQKLGMSQFTCVNLNDNHMLLKMSCPAYWKDEKTRFRCEHPDSSFQDPILDAPITSLQTNLTYRNWHCASCHRDLYAGKTQIWPVFFNCANWMKLDEERLLNHLVYDIGNSSWVLNITDYISIFSGKESNQSYYFESCDVGVQPPEGVKSILRHCSKHLIDSCPPDWTDNEVRTQCESYLSYICSSIDNQMYRNYYCGYCNNNGTFKSIICVGKPVVRAKPPADFSLLFDWHKLSKRSTCSDMTEEYDPLSKTCRKLFEINEVPEGCIDETEGMLVGTADEGSENCTNKPTNNITLDAYFLTCPKFHLDSDEYVRDNESGTVFVPVYNRTYSRDEYRIESDGQLSICAVYEVESEEEEFSLGLFYVTIIGISLSIFFLILHVVLFFLTPRLRNLSSMNLTSLSISLLMTYCAFLAGWQLEDTDVPCIVAAVVMHYSLLAAFCWMFIISYDISRVLRESTSKLMVTSGKHWKRFCVYSALCWLVPAFISAATLAVQYSDIHHKGLHPGFGREFCWFSNAEALLLFCLTPTFVVMLLNIIFFCWSTYIVFSTSLNMRDSSNTQPDFWLYARLALIMGLTWITGLVGSYINVEGEDYLYVQQMFRCGYRLLIMGYQQNPGHLQYCRHSTIAKSVQEVTIPVPWGHVAGKWWGDTNVQPILGLHGWEDNAATFDTLAPMLNVPSFLAIDLVGHGMSSYFPLGCTYNFLDAVTLVRRIITHYKWKKVSFIGHSFGSAMAFLYSALYPDQVDKYVSIDCARSLLLAPEGKYFEQNRDTLDKILDIEKKLGTSPPSYDYDDLLQRTYEGSGRSPTLESCALLLKRGLRKSSQDDSKCYLSRDPRVKLNWLGKMPEEFIMACAERIECEVLSIRGKQGFLFHGISKQVYENSLKLLRNCEHHDVEGSHHVHLNNPENIAPLINKFFCKTKL